MKKTSTAPPTAGIVIIGNEILSAKIQDQNSFYLLQALRAIGVVTQRVLIIPDQGGLIAETVRTFSAQFDWVFTCGGIGPTHDDKTIESIAAAFEIPVVEAPELAARLKARYGTQLKAEHLRMAQIPEGAELIPQPDGHFPQVRYRNVFIFPGVPDLLKIRFANIKSLLGGQIVTLCNLYLQADEGNIAAMLEETEHRFEAVELGSYPQWKPQLRGRDTYSVKITIEGLLQEQVLAAVNWLEAQLISAGVPIIDKEWV